MRMKATVRKKIACGGKDVLDANYKDYYIRRGDTGAEGNNKRHMQRS